jgi:hypothetical protein
MHDEDGSHTFLTFAKESFVFLGHAAPERRFLSPFWFISSLGPLFDLSRSYSPRHSPMPRSDTSPALMSDDDSPLGAIVLTGLMVNDRGKRGAYYAVFDMT